MCSKALISCFYDGTPLPVGFSWTETMSQRPYRGKYRLTMLLHGECLKYGLRNSIYKNRYGIENPNKLFLSKMGKRYKVKIIICHLCLNKDGFKSSDLLSFVRPIPFSVDYILKFGSKHQVVYDAKQN